MILGHMFSGSMLSGFMASVENLSFINDFMSNSTQSGLSSLNLDLTESLFVKL